ncbi:histone deacetylase family protein [Halopenitus persicus]|uniref:Acetoin utilization deacetylase AcuC n=1 Tax=Halopenitus persicus TaxID=1048396 RepID=A0A1H3G4I4_9EURY|nr:histone deacetylase [Halopenitus persicus]SDX97289.1 Acetoin utilization deacetylase AcuC [Halopenitus persicus]
MQFGYSEVCLEHDTGERHPETPDRLRAIRKGLRQRHGVSYHEATPATRSAVAAVHDEDYVDEVEAFCADGGGNWDPDTVACEETWDAALASAGLAQWAAREALAGATGRDAPFAIGRPPGHHAVADDAMGFCFVNNAAVAAQTVIDEEPVDRVAIFDWDVHHGNGTQDIFYDRGDVLYASIHEQGLYPGTGEIDETGTGDGEGATVNVPLSAGAGDVEYCAVLDEVLDPMLAAFDPDLLLVSAGFDAHRHDPISRMRVSSEGYALLTDRVRDIADRIGAALGFVLEGGYGLDTLAEGVGMVHETFDGREPVEPEGELNGSTRVLINDVESQFDR